MLWADTERGQGRPTFPTAARTESSAPPAAGELSRLTEKVQGRAYTPGCGGSPAGDSDLAGFLHPSRIPGAPGPQDLPAPTPAHRRGGKRQGPAPAPARPAAGVRASASQEAPVRPAASPRPAPGQEAPLPRPLHPPPRSPGAVSPQGVRTTRRKAWAPWCRRHRRLPLSPASRRLAKQRRAAAKAAAPAQVPAAAAATSTSGRGSAHP